MALSVWLAGCLSLSLTQTHTRTHTHTHARTHAHTHTRERERETLARAIYYSILLSKEVNFKISLA